jgi:hypothetical protein
MEGETVVCLATRTSQATTVRAAREFTRVSEKVNQANLSALVRPRWRTPIPFGSADSPMEMLSVCRMNRNTGNSEACHFTVAQTAGFRQFFSQLRCRFLTFAEASLDLPFRCFLLPRQSVYGFWRRKATRRFV